VEFDEKGVCNGCNWAEKKNTDVDWAAREKELRELCDKYRSKDGNNWDVIVPCSGGKDSYHIAWTLKDKFNMNPLLVKLSALIPTEVGEWNMRNLVKQGLDLIEVTPNLKTYAGLCKKGFIEQGRPQMGFVTGVSTVVLRMSMAMGVPFIMYGEEGESEYGGKEDMRHSTGLKRDWVINTYLSGFDPKEYVDENFSKMSLATVYNTLNTLVEAGVLKALKLPHTDKVIYDCNVSKHYHFLDLETGNLFDISPEDVQVESQLGQKFDIEDMEVVIKGRIKK